MKYLPYFAYGSNMDCRQMRLRCPESYVVSVARLPDYKFYINTRGVASIEPSLKDTVYGILWNVPEDTLRLLDQYEGVSQGFYYRREIPVKCNHQIVKSIVYISPDSHRGTPRLGYLEKILRASLDFDLPFDYIAQIARCSHFV